MIHRLLAGIAGVYGVGANAPVPGTRVPTRHAVRVLLAGAAVTWAISTLTKITGDVRDELASLVDERNRLRAEVAELRDDVSEEELARVDVDEPADHYDGPLVDLVALAADVDRHHRPEPEPAADVPPTTAAGTVDGEHWGACTAMNTLTDSSCVLGAEHRGSHRDSEHRVWRRLAAAPDAGGELEPAAAWGTTPGDGLSGP